MLSQSTPNDRERGALDLVWGVRGPDGIAAFLGIDERRTRYLIEIGALPIKKLGHRTLVASKAELLRACAALASAA